MASGSGGSETRIQTPDDTPVFKDIHVDPASLQPSTLARPQGPRFTLKPRRRVIPALRIRIAARPGEPEGRDTPYPPLRGLELVRAGFLPSWLTRTEGEIDGHEHGEENGDKDDNGETREDEMGVEEDDGEFEDDHEEEDYGAGFLVQPVGQAEAVNAGGADIDGEENDDGEEEEEVDDDDDDDVQVLPSTSSQHKRKRDDGDEDGDGDGDEDEDSDEDEDVKAFTKSSKKHH